MKDELRNKLQKNNFWFYKILDNITEEQLLLPVQDAGDNWTAIQVLRHIAYSELSIVRLLDDVINGSEGMPENYALDEANAKSQDILQDKNLDSIRARMEKSRVASLELLDRIKEDDWEKTGRYFTGSIMSVKRMFEILIWHQSHHSKQITTKIDTADWK